MKKVNNWPRRIRALRKRLYRTQEEFAHDLDVTVRCIAYWESGARTPKGLYRRAVEEAEEWLQKEVGK